MDVGQNQPEQLKRAMTSRHLFMISLGGVIGTGFFLGTGYTIGQAGPVGAVLSYIVGGLIMYLTMLCLGSCLLHFLCRGRFIRMRRNLSARQRVLLSAGFIGSAGQQRLPLSSYQQGS